MNKSKIRIFLDIHYDRVNMPSKKYHPHYTSIKDMLEAYVDSKFNIILHK